MNRFHPDKLPPKRALDLPAGTLFYCDDDAWPLRQKRVCAICGKGILVKWMKRALNNVRCNACVKKP